MTVPAHTGELLISLSDCMHSQVSISAPGTGRRSRAQYLLVEETNTEQGYLLWRDSLRHARR